MAYSFDPLLYRPGDSCGHPNYTPSGEARHIVQTVDLCWLNGRSLPGHSCSPGATSLGRFADVCSSPLFAAGGCAAGVSVIYWPLPLPRSRELSQPATHRATWASVSKKAVVVLCTMPSIMNPDLQPLPREDCLSENLHTAVAEGPKTRGSRASFRRFSVLCVALAIRV
jgi:hypothetical protein